LRDTVGFVGQRRGLVSFLNWEYVSDVLDASVTSDPGLSDRSWCYNGK
jgi:hypothetical protein